MLMQIESGDGLDLDVSVAAERIERLLGRLLDGSDEEVRGFLARLLREAGFPAKRGAMILRCGRTAYFDDLARPFPGINDAPKRNRSRRERPDGTRGADLTGGV